MKPTGSSKRLMFSPLGGGLRKSKRGRFDKENEKTDDALCLGKIPNWKPFREQTLTKSLESDSMEQSGEENEKDGVSDYEKTRLKNIQANKDFLANIGMLQAKDDLRLSAMKPKLKATQRGIKREKSPPLPRRSSLRIQRMDPKGSPLPEIIEPAIVKNEHERPPSGELQMNDYLYGATETAHNDRLRLKINSVEETKFTPAEGNLASFVKALSKLKITENQVAKVVPDRVFSVAIHSSLDKVIVCAGGKWGGVGIWDVNNVDDDLNGVVTYSPHSRPVSHLAFPASHQDRLYSCSYDGSLRCAHFEKGIFDEVYSVDRDDYVLLRNFEFLCADTLLVAQSDGCVALVDQRTNMTGAESLYSLQNKTLRNVSIHPTDRNYFLTSCANGEASVWDLRNMNPGGKKKNHSVTDLQHEKGVNAAHFSPITGKFILTTSMDNKLRLFDSSTIGSKMAILQSIRHNNFTGRWLTPFRSVWHPAREDVFVVGSMERPRRIEFYDILGRQVKYLMDEDFLGSVCSLNAVHPSRDIVVGGNSSGRLHVFM